MDAHSFTLIEPKRRESPRPNSQIANAAQYTWNGDLASPLWLKSYVLVGACGQVHTIGPGLIPTTPQTLGAYNIRKLIHPIAKPVIGHNNSTSLLRSFSTWHAYSFGHET
jgi:hypothetical protein